MLKIIAPRASYAFLALFLACLSTPAHSSERLLVAEVIACEASGEPYAGQVAVASVIKTRMTERHQTAEQVVKARKQFSCWTGAHLVRRVTDREYNTALRAWNESRAGVYNHYYAYKLCSPSWAKHAILSLTIGGHRFIKL